MRAVLQRVSSASVTVDDEVVGAVERGLCVLVGAEDGDTAADVEWVASKIVGARVFPDEDGKMNLDVRDVGGRVLAVPQFTLLGDLRKGRRPSFSRALEPTRAVKLFDDFCAAVRTHGVPVETGRFREHMEVALVNQGPVTLLVDSRKTF